MAAQFKQKSRPTTSVYKPVQNKGNTGKSGNSTLIHTLANAVPLRIMFLGLGNRESMTESTIRDALGSAVRKARGIGVTSIAVAVDTFSTKETDSNRVAAITTMASINGLYRYENHVSEKSETTVTEILLNMESAAESNVASYTAIAEAVNLARDLSNAPPNHMTPTILSNIAKEKADENGIGFELIDEKAMKSLSNLLPHSSFHNRNHFRPSP